MTTNSGEPRNRSNVVASGLWHAMLSASLDAIVAMDDQGRVLEFNPQAEQLFGHQRDQVIGEVMGDLLVPERLREAHRNGLRRYLETGEDHILGRRLELWALRKDGTEFPVELTITRAAVDGPPIFVGQIRDITARRKARSDAEILNAVSEALSDSYDLDATLQAAARAVVPDLADWCNIELIDAEGVFRSVAVAHVDPDKVELIKRFRDNQTYTLDDGTDFTNVGKTGEPTVYAEITTQTLRKALFEEEDVQTLQQLGLASSVVLPLNARGATVGVLALAQAESGGNFEESDMPMLKEMARRIAGAVEVARLLDQQSHIARTLQEALLPPSLPAIPGIEVGALYRPALTRAEVGGDFYDVFKFAENRWALVVGDVQGKGVEAAALVGLARHTLRATGYSGLAPEDVMVVLNRALVHNPDDRLCTACLVFVEPGDSGFTATIVAAGHPAPLILQADGSVIETAARGTILGAYEPIELRIDQVELPIGSTLFAYTDGLIGRSDDDVRAVKAAVSALTPASRVTEMVVALGGDMDARFGPNPPDDATALIARVI